MLGADAAVDERRPPSRTRKGALADAPPAEVRHLIRPLGLPGRAEVLQAAASRAVAEHGGGVPRDPQVLVTWKGIGRYTANAVACLGYDAPYPMVDEVVGRLLRRLAGVVTEVSVYSDGELWDWARDLALLHVSKEVCTARNPRCDICALRDVCWSASTST